MGFSAAESMTGIDIIKRPHGNRREPTGDADATGRVPWRFRKLDNTGCVLTMYYKGALLWTKTAGGHGGIYRGGREDAGTYRQNRDLRTSEDPSSMYFARAITRAQRRYAPGVLGIDVLSSEEAIDMPRRTPQLACRCSTQVAPVIDDSDLPNVIPAGLSFASGRPRSEADSAGQTAAVRSSQGSGRTPRPRRPDIHRRPLQLPGPDLAAHGCGRWELELKQRMGRWYFE